MRSCTKRGGETYVTGKDKLTSKGKELFSQIAVVDQLSRAESAKAQLPNWHKKMERVFGEEGLNQPAAEVQVLQIVVAGKPQSEASVSASLAEYAYKAHNTRIGDLASAKAVASPRPRNARG